MQTQVIALSRWVACNLITKERLTDFRVSVAEKFEERQQFNLHETHFDIITKPAPGMTVLGYGKNTPVQMCCHGDHFLGTQFPWDLCLE